MVALELLVLDANCVTRNDGTAFEWRCLKILVLDAKGGDAEKAGTGFEWRHWKCWY